MKQLCFFLILFPIVIFGQKKTCNTPEESLEDLNSITKCQIKPAKNSSKKSGQISVKVSANKKRFMKKRKASSLKAENLRKINSAIKKKALSISNLLSIEEVRKADRFATVDEVPAFEKCVNTKGDERMDCFNREMIAHIQEYFDYPEEAIVKKMSGEVWVRFIIDKNGNVTNIKTHTKELGKELLKEEATRVVSHLKNFKPAIKGGSPVPVKYGFPIKFSLDEN